MANHTAGDMTVDEHTGWVYTLRDRDPDDDPEQWATAVAREGWQFWPADTGGPVIVNARQLIRYSLRRPTNRVAPGGFVTVGVLQPPGDPSSRCCRCTTLSFGRGSSGCALSQRVKADRAAMRPDDAGRASGGRWRPRRARDAIRGRLAVDDAREVVSRREFSRRTPPGIGGRLPRGGSVTLCCPEGERRSRAKSRERRRFWAPEAVPGSR